MVAPLLPGFVRLDPHVAMAVRSRRPFVTAFPGSAASRGVRRIARALVQECHPPVAADTRGLRAALKARFGLAGA